jgi:hypothetical protein
LAATKYWHRQNIGGDKILAQTEMFATTEIIGVDKMLAATNSRVSKNLASTKCWCRRRRISLLFGSLMISYISQKLLIPWHAVTKCGVVSGCPAFMADSLPYRTGLLYQPAIQKTSQILELTKSTPPPRFTDFRQTIAVNISAHRRPIKKW